VDQVKEEKSILEVVKAWKCTLKFETVPELFGLHINFAPANFNELESFNEGLGVLADKLEHFSGSVNAANYLGIVKKNLKLIKAALVEIETSLNGPPDHRAELEKWVKVINDNIQKLNNFGAVYGSPIPHLQWDPKLKGTNGVIDGATFSPKTSGTTYAAVYGTVQCPIQYEWKVKIHTNSIWLALGVATKEPFSPLDIWGGGEPNWFVFAQKAESTPTVAYPAASATIAGSWVAGEIITLHYDGNLHELKIKSGSGNLNGVLRNIPQNVWPFAITYSDSVTLV